MGVPTLRVAWPSTMARAFATIPTAIHGGMKMAYCTNCETTEERDFEDPERDMRCVLCAEMHEDNLHRIEDEEHAPTENADG
jgi:NAD-dependent SIR2 family protein deacetylase